MKIADIDVLKAAVRDDAFIAFRRMARNRGSTLSIVVLLALAIAVGGCVFTVAYGLLWKPLPYPEQDRLVQLKARSIKMGIDLGWSVPYLDAVAVGSQQLDAVAGYRQKQVAIFDRNGKYTGSSDIVTAEPHLFQLLGARPGLGRLLVPDDAKLGSDPVAVIGSDLWNGRFGGSQSVLGQVIRIEGRNHRIVGVLPERFAFPVRDIQVWLPMEFSEAERALNRTGSFGSLRAVGRIRSGGTTGDASSEMMRLVRSDETLKGIADEINLETVARPLRYLWIGDREASLKSMLLAALLVFIVTVANVCNLFLLRMLRRRQELALLEAMGASCARRALQTVWEAALVGLGGALASLALIPMGLALLRYVDVLPTEIPQVIDFEGATLVAVLIMSAVAAAAMSVSGMAIQGQNVNEVLRQTGNGQTPSYRTHRARQALVVGQIAVTLVLLFGTALLVRSSHHLLSQDIGFDRSNQLVGRIQPAAWAEDEDLSVVRGQIASWISSVQALPGVRSVALSTSAPFSDMVSTEAFSREGAAEDGSSLPNAYVSYVSSQYFEALGQPLLRGRPFTSEEAESGAPVAIIDESLARRYFGNDDPIGKTLSVNDSGVGELIKVSVVGVTSVARQRTLLRNDEYPSIYRPDAVPYSVHGIPTESVELIVRTDGSSALADVLQKRLEAAVPSLKLDPLVTMERRISETVVDEIRLNSLLLLLGAMTIILTAVGLYALLSYTVAMRYKEFGIRLALGATASSLMSSMFAQGGRLMAIAFAVGLPLALLLGSMLRPRLHEIGPFDPASLVAVVCLLLAVAVIANVFPAYRASRIKPMEALRTE